MKKPQIGLIGLGTMGAAIALNIAEKGFPLAVWNRTAQVTREFHASAGLLAAVIVPTTTLQEFVQAMTAPRAIILMVPAGDAVDAQIAALRPLLGPDDLIIDAGNADFHDTNRRTQEAGTLPFLGIGVSGGEDGARYGPSIMGGGAKQHWDRVAPVLESISAKYGDTPCATWMGQAGAGHFVKAVHNGIEYADMQMIAEIYGILRDGMGLDSTAIANVFARWNDGPLQSYLIEISQKVAEAVDNTTGAPMLDVILDQAGQKGTGRWTVIEAHHLGAPVPAIEAAVAARNLSSRLEERKEGEALFGPAPRKLPDQALGIHAIEQALIVGKILCYAQGFALLSAASEAYDWDLQLPAIAKVWRAGCIIRSAMLDDMASALAEDNQRNLMLAPHFAGLIKNGAAGFRQTVGTAIAHGLPVPALSSGISYFDMMRTGRSTANMIQAQRDFFGAHGFERVDRAGTGHHGPWGKMTKGAA